jgi:uncharacterized protein (UPF0305 family)
VELFDDSGISTAQAQAAGLSGVQSFSDYSPSGSDGDNYAQTTADIIAQPRVGSNRSNITNLVDSSGRSLYDPQFAAALDITRGLDPTNNMGGTGGLAVPSYLRPQLTGDIASDFRGSYNLEPKYFSPVERFLQTTGAEIAQSGPGIIGLVGRMIGPVLNDGLKFLTNSKAGNTVENVATEKRGKEIAELEKERLEQGLNTNFEPYPSITKTNLDRNFKTEPTNILDSSFMDRGASLATNAEGISLLPTYLDQTEKNLISANRRAKNISELLDQMKKETANVEIDAGDKKGQTLSKVEPTSNLYDGSQYNDLAMQSLKNLGYNVEVPNLPNVFPVSRPFPGTDEVAVQRGTDGYYFANASDRKLDIPERISNFTFPNLTEGQIMASDDEGYSFEPTTNLATLGLQRDPTQFIKKASLPAELQGIVSLNTDLDYGQTTPLNVLLENTPLAITARNRALKKEAEKKQKEIAEAEAFKKFRESLPSIRVGGGYRGEYEPVVPNYAKNFAPSLPPLY